MDDPASWDLILAISPDNTLIHVGPADQMLAHLGLHPATKSPRAATQALAISAPPVGEDLEFFDVTAESVSVSRLSQFTERPEPGPAAQDSGSLHREQALLRRIDAALAFGEQYLAEHPEAGRPGSGQPTSFPAVSGGYQDVLEQLSTLFYPLDPSLPTNQGNWFHNLWHKATGSG